MDKAASAGHSNRCRIVVDTCCDFSPEVAANLDVDILGFPFIIDGEERTDDIWSSMSPKEFYDRMRAGARVSTSAVSLGRYIEFLPSVPKGHAHGLPVLYLGAVVELQLRVPGGGRRARRVSRF
ncbi:MAG: DegV family protein [Collinsella sp.]